MGHKHKKIEINKIIENFKWKGLHEYATLLTLVCSVNFCCELFYLQIFRLAVHALIAFIIKQIWSTIHNSTFFSLRVSLLLHIGAQLSKRGRLIPPGIQVSARGSNGEVILHFHINIWALFLSQCLDYFK